MYSHFTWFLGTETSSDVGIQQEGIPWHIHVWVVRLTWNGNWTHMIPFKFTTTLDCKLSLGICMQGFHQACYLNKESHDRVLYLSQLKYFWFFHLYHIYQEYNGKAYDTSGTNNSISTFFGNLLRQWTADMKCIISSQHWRPYHSWVAIQ